MVGDILQRATTINNILSNMAPQQVGASEPCLPPGYRFHPTDEELVVYYLANKVADFRFTVAAIGEVDLNKCEPWDLPERAKMGEKEWYFFSLKDRKYPTGLRTNRATMAGYWKATGKDREVMSISRYGAGCYLVGMKKTLVFYKGRAPKGEKTNWIMHEYRLEGEPSLLQLSKMACKDEWVVCRIFKKSSSGKKTFSEGSMDIDEHALPPLLDSPHTHTACNGNGAEDMSGNAEKAEQPSSDSLSGPLYHNDQDTSFTTNCLPNSSVPPSGYNPNFWGSVGTIAEMSSNSAGLRYSELSYSPACPDSTYPSLLSSCQISENLTHKPGIQAGMSNVELHPSSAELGILLQQCTSPAGLCKAEATAEVESQLAQLIQMYKDPSAWSGIMLTSSHNEEMAATPQAHHHTIFNAHNLPFSMSANQSSNCLTAGGNNAINQAINMDLIGEALLISPQHCDFNRAVLAAQHHHHQVGAVWASQY
ncbi:hypothetical protein GOP47_0024828 [Adiantum capillus-veneris]|uniref:NAC domain-containing protein n=1 Tax=Adiantum capillus-veneris TaxID=13818 RepID=A0A9D4U3Q3_ADICA|nr:hypothetical protein GOP47_0024828 [Adiantum capillus-veneris]